MVWCNNLPPVSIIFHASLFTFLAVLTRPSGTLQHHPSRGLIKRQTGSRQRRDAPSQSFCCRCQPPMCRAGARIDGNGNCASGAIFPAMHLAEIVGTDKPDKIDLRVSCFKARTVSISVKCRAYSSSLTIKRRSLARSRTAARRCAVLSAYGFSAGFAG